jgi:hypothetical protein
MYLHGAFNRATLECPSIKTCDGGRRYTGALNRFTNKTGYKMEQFLGRLAKFKLPETLSREDVIAVAQIHFPEIALPYLKMIAARAMQCAGYLQAVEFTALYARHLAKRAGREGNITEEDVERAIAERMPGKTDAARQNRPCTHVADQVKEPRRVARTLNNEFASESLPDSGRILEPSLAVA